MKVYVIVGNHDKLGHYMMEVPLGVYSKIDDAEFMIEINNKVFGWRCRIVELELDSRIHKDSEQAIIDAGYTIPKHMEPI